MDAKDGQETYQSIFVICQREALEEAWLIAMIKHPRICRRTNSQMCVVRTSKILFGELMFAEEKFFHQGPLTNMEVIILKERIWTLQLKTRI